MKFNEVDWDEISRQKDRSHHPHWVQVYCQLWELAGAYDDFSKEQHRNGHIHASNVIAKQQQQIEKLLESAGATTTGT